MYLQGRIYNYQKRGPSKAILAALDTPIGLINPIFLVSDVLLGLDVSSILLSVDNIRRFNLKFQETKLPLGGLAKTITQAREVIEEEGVVFVRDVPSDSNLISDILYIKRKS